MARLIAERADALPALGEVFREHGFEGASLSLISEATGLGKGSLYHFFPGGKEEMANAVLDEIDGWFETQVFAPLRHSPSPEDAIAAMFDNVEAYFRSGRRVCLVGVLAIGASRDRFKDRIHGYFARWVAALRVALEGGGHSSALAQALAEDVVGGIQGAIVLSRALDDLSVFSRSMTALRDRVQKG